MQPDGPQPTRNQQVLDEFRDRFVRTTRYGSDLLRLFGKSEVRVFRYEPDPPGRWWLHLVLPERTALMFDTRLEVVCLYTEYERVEPRLLSVLQLKLRRDARVEPEFAIVVSLDDELEQLVSRRRGEFAVLSLHGAHLKNSGDQRDLRTRMVQVLTTLDHYDFTFPVTEVSGFFGRRQELDSLNFSLSRGQPVGIFGLRKAGKTSLLNFVQRQREAANKPVVRLDMSEVSSGDEFKLELVKRTHQVLVRRSGSAPKLKLLAREGTYRAIAPPVNLYWIEDLSLMLDVLDLRLELIVDEIDQAYPDRSTLGKDVAGSIFVGITQLRGLIQRRESANANSLVLLCAGVDPAIFERSTINRRDNLLYKLVRLQFLAPMEREEMAEMVRSLGKRMALRYRDHRVIDFLYHQYGGHPLLTRKACSWACRNRPLDQVPWDVPLEAVQAADRRRGYDTPTGQAADVLESFQEWFPDEAELLRMVWSSADEERELARQLISGDPSVGDHVVAYGIANADWTPRIAALLPLIEK